jgi:CheY-like chemotaxis protein/anti-sigma regulatory factor (Ser/Thr protein kinase)
VTNWVTLPKLSLLKVELVLDVTQVERTTVIGDPVRIRQIVTNLVGNAIKFTHHGEVVVTANLQTLAAKQARLRISVSDTGIGIPDDKISNLFESFTQVDASTTRKFGGTGLGLAIVKNLCEMMGGSVEVQSEYGSGSTFTAEIAIELGSKSSLVMPSVSVKGKSILIVDDNTTNREVLRGQLEHWGMQVYETASAPEAQQLCHDAAAKTSPPFDIAFLDMQMPGMDGAQLGEALRKMPENGSMKLVMMTSLGSRGDAQRFADLGFDAFFPKPTTTQDLFYALNVLVEDSDALHRARPLLTRDYLGTLEKEEETAWPEDTRLLLVEDNETNQMVAKGMLESIGLTASVAINGIDALKTLTERSETEPFTLILMDCQMPEMDGYETTRAIKAGEVGDAYRSVPVIAMTANAMQGDREKCFAAGMDDYISKPINPLALKDILKKWLLNEASVSGRDPASIAETPEASIGLPVWDETDALARFGGKAALLTRVMSVFVNDIADQLTAFDEALADDDAKSCQLHAHSIKGSSANVSAQKLHSLGKALEASAREGELKTLKARLPELKNAVDEILKRFNDYLKRTSHSETEERTMTAAALNKALTQLRSELQEGAFIDVDTLEIFNGYADKVIAEKLMQLKKAIGRFAFDDALGTLDAILQLMEKEPQ